MLKKLLTKCLLKIVCICTLLFNCYAINLLYANLNTASTCCSDITNYIEPLQSGSWQDTNIWTNGVLPTLNDEVLIPANMIIELNGEVVAKYVEVHGTLKATYLPVTDAWIDMTTKAIHVMDGGHFEIGTAANPYYGDCLITLIGNDPYEIICSSMGAKFIGAMSGGRIDLHGKPKTCWTQLDTTAHIGATEITLKEPVNWQLGDEIVIASSTINWFEAEKRVITSISADSLTISFADTLTHKHLGTIKNYTRDTDGKIWEADLRAEVGLLSHNIKIQGDDFSEVNGFGGHIMIHEAAEGYVSGIELYRMGQKSFLGTYPFHWHRVGSGGNGQYFKNSSVHISYNRGITIHATESTLVDNNFFFDHIGHGVYLEDGCERFNTITNNLVMFTRKPVIGEEVTQSDIFGFGNSLQDRSPSSYWISNPNNNFDNNVAAGTEGTGFWFAFPFGPMGASANDPRFAGQRPYKEPLGSFNNNKAHSSGRGFDIFDGMTEDHEIISNSGWQNGQMNYITNCTWYANDLGLYTGVNKYVNPDNLIIENNIFVENEVAIMFASYSLANECLFVSNSGENLLNGNRYLYRVYDGSGRVENSHFVGWDQLNSNFLINTGAATKHVNHLFKNITKDHSAPMRMALPNVDITPNSFIDANNVAHPRYWSLVLRDIDGTIGGKANTSIICNHPFLLTGGEFQAAEWTNTYRSDHAFALAKARYNMPSANNPNVTITRSKPGTPPESIYYINGYKEHHQLPFIVNEDFLYSYQYESLPSSKTVELFMDDAIAGDTFLTRFVNFGKLSGLYVISPDQNLTPFTHLDDLKAANSTGYYIEPNGDLYLQTVATGKIQKFDIKWTGNITLPVLDSDGDGSNDGYEAEQRRNPFDESDLASNFETDHDFQHWNDSIVNIKNLQVHNGWLKGTVDSLDNPRLTKNDYRFHADSIISIIVEMKASQNTTTTLYWERSDTILGINDSISVTYSGNGSTSSLGFDVGNHAGWHGIIEALHFKPADQANTIFEIDIIKASDQNLDHDGDGYTTKAESQINRNPMSAADLCFDFSTNSEGWFKAGTTENECFGCDGGWSVESYATDPQIHFNNFNFLTNEVPKLYVDVQSEVSGNFQLFWKTTQKTSFSASKRVSKYYNNTGRQVIVFDLANHPEWSGDTITSLRLDPVGDIGETVFYGICATELCYPYITDFISSIATTGETCNNADGSMTITFNDNPFKTGIQFSLDGGLTYQPMLNDTVGSVTYTNLPSDNYALHARWDDGGCEESIANQSIQKDPIKEIFVSPTNESCEGNDGTFSFVFFDNPLQTHIEFSFDGGNTYQTPVPDNSGIVTYTDFAAGSYPISARWADGSCIEDLGLHNIMQDVSPTVLVSSSNATCEGIDGSITFTFADEFSHNGLQFSLDGGLNYQAVVNDTLESFTYGGLVPNTYSLTVQWSDGTCVVDLGEQIIEVNPYPNANIVIEHETCAQNNGSITFSFEDDLNQSGVQFSLDGGNTYEAIVSDTLGLITYANLVPDIYTLSMSWADNTCATNLGQYQIEAEALPEISVSHTNETCALNDGSITFSFQDHPSKDSLQFCLDGGANFLPAVNDSIGYKTYENLSSDTYILHFRWNDGSCETSINTTIIEEAILPQASITHTNETCLFNDGSISMSFPDFLEQDSIAFSINGGNTYLPALSDATTTATYNNLPTGVYAIFAAFENETCPTDLNTNITILGEVDTDLDGVCDTEDTCEGFDDELDDDNDNIPDACDLCTNYWEDLTLPNINNDQSAKISLRTNGKISTGTNIILNAGERIHFSTGFSVEAGAEFGAHIEPCVD